MEDYIEGGNLPEEFIYYSHELCPDFQLLDILGISDVHYGNPYHSPERFKLTLDFLSRPASYAFLNGDLCESALRTSKGDIFKQVGSPEDQRDRMTEMLYPYRAKLLGAVDGNHEARIWNDVGVHIIKDIAKELGIPYRSEGMLHKISFGSGNSRNTDKPFVFWLYHTHGYGGARTKSAKAVKVERLATWMHADIYCMSHDHVVNVAPDVYFLPDPRTHLDKNSGFIIGKIQAHRKMLVKTNAYLKWGGYSEFGGFPPTDLATPLIKLLTPKSEYWNELPDKSKQAVKVIV
jgi:hypothetical protein